MSDSMDKAIGQLKDMLSTEEGQREIEAILEGVQPYNSSPSALSGPNKRAFNTDAFMRIKNIMDKIQSDNDPRIQLLASLRPYISKSRGYHIDNAIKIMSLGKLPYLLRNSRESD